MAIGTAAAIGLGLAGIGGIMDSRNKNKQAKQQNAFNQQQYKQAMGMMQQGPSAAETYGMGMLQNMGGQMPQAYQPMQVGMPNFNPQMADVGGYLQSGGFNTGQDSIMQMLRADPRTKVDETLQGMIDQQGNPFDTSEMFRALGVIDQRNTDSAVAQTRAGSSGLGQRFGSYMQRTEGNMRTQANENAAARNAGIQMQSYEAAQGRRMGGLGMLSGREQFNRSMNANLAQMLQQGGLSAAGLQLQGVGSNNAAMQAQAGMDLQSQLANQSAGLNAAQMNQQGMLAGQQNQAQILQTLLAAQQGRQVGNTNLLGLAGGQAPVAGPGYGGVIGGLGTAVMLPGVLRSNPLGGRR